MMADRNPNPEPVVRPLNLTARQQKPNAAIQLLASLGQLFAADTRRGLPFLARQRARVWASEVLAHDSPELPPLVAGPSFVVRMKGPSDIWAMFHLDSDAVATLFDGLLGSSSPKAGDEEGAPEAHDDSDDLDGGNPSPPAFGDDLTIAQRALIRRVALDLAAELARIAKSGCKIELEVSTCETLKLGQELAIPADGICVDCMIDDVPRPCRLRVWLGATAVQAVMAEQSEPAGAGGAATFHQGLVGVPVEVVAELGRVTMPLSQLLSLERGTILRLPVASTDPVLVRVGGLPKFHAVPVISRGQVSVQIQTRREE
jgi:flagellar motor switch/type III secretory pathway protein FliN